jgi:hypothetical protein
LGWLAEANFPLQGAPQAQYFVVAQAVAMAAAVVVAGYQ